jgi:hypothetical protein
MERKAIKGQITLVPKILSVRLQIIYAGMLRYKKGRHGVGKNSAFFRVGIPVFPVCLKKHYWSFPLAVLNFGDIKEKYGN